MSPRAQTKRSAWCVALLLGVLLAVPAHAQDDSDNKQLNMSLEGGIGDFTGNLAGLTSAGPTWGVVLGFQPFTMVGLEVGYMGSRNTVTDSLTRINGTLTRHGLSTLLKLSPPFMKKVRPFAGIGMGISHVSASDAGPFESDTMEEVPLAAGIELNTPSVTAGFRATYRFLVDDQLVASDQSPGGLFDAAVTFGGRF